MDKQTARTIISQLLAKALTAIIKIVKTKLLPKAMERYCKSLQKFAEKLAEKTNQLIDKIPTITDVKKLTGTLYVLRLVQETANTVGEALKTLAHSIETNVDFSIIDDPKTDEVASAVQELDVIANAVTDVDLQGNCGPDGCEIA